MIVAFEKSYELRHIGHLDLLRVLQRALRRAGLPVGYSQGFNPHMLIAFASPLPVGQSGREELCEVVFERAISMKECIAGLARAMPPGLAVKTVRQVGDEHPRLMAMLRTASYMIQVEDGRDGEMVRQAAEAIPSFMERETIPAIRISKSGQVEVDIRPWLHELEYVEPLQAFHTRVAFTERETLKPDLLIRTLFDYAAGEPDAASTRNLTIQIERVRMYGDFGGDAASLIDC